jgi:penicillin amidase
MVSAAGIYYFKKYLPAKIAPFSFPQTDGEIHLSGLEGRVDIYRDSMGIPHIYASSVADLFFTQGYVHAQDRFWQMDTWRHIGSGELSEMFGESQVETDTFLRTLGWRRIAEQEYKLYDEHSRDILIAYSEGVNAYLVDHRASALSLEYTILKLLTPDYIVEPWEPIHTLTWGKAMAWDLRANMSEEIERAILLKSLGPERVDELFPPYPVDHPVIVNQLDTGNVPGFASSIQGPMDLPPELLAAVEYKNKLLDPILGANHSGKGSNSWAISGELTETGSAFLANDPHLSSQMPSIWYQVDLVCKPKTLQCPYSVTGFSFAGVPGVIIGHNEDIAWGFTNVGPDVMDLFIEKVNPQNPDEYEADGNWVEFDQRTETLLVAGGETLKITIRSTRHGPVISEVYGLLKDEGDPKDKEFLSFKDHAGMELPEKFVVSLAWTALSPSSIFQAIWGFNTAHNWEDFRQAARAFDVPSQNLIYADVQGNIGYQMPGDIPLRKAGDGRYPVPGWTGEYDWDGYIPFEELPHSFNPPEGFIATANNQIPPADYPYLITTDWDYGYRAQRIVDLLRSAPGKINIEYIQGMQADNLDPIAEILVPVLVETGKKANSTEAAKASEILEKWDFKAGADSPGAAIFEATWNHLLQNTFNDDLPLRYRPEGGDRWMEIMRRIVSDPGSAWWDDQSTTSQVETRDQIFERSFSDAVTELGKKYGNDPAKWSWGSLHSVTFRNGTLGESGIGMIEDLFNRGPFPTGGSKAIINATGWDIGETYEVDWLPSMRMIVDMGNLNNSLAIHTTGQSGHAYHPNYIDMAKLWADVKYAPMAWNEQDIIKNAIGHLILEP